MKLFNDFINENTDKYYHKDYHKYRKPYDSLIVPLENIIQKLLNNDKIEVFCYSENSDDSMDFNISFKYPYSESGNIHNINDLMYKNDKDNITLKKLKDLGKLLNSKDIYIEYANSLYHTIKYTIDNKYLNSNYFKSLRSIGKFNL